MSYYQSLTKAGRTRIYQLYYSVRQNDGTGPRETRAPREKPSTEKQVEINRKAAERKLTALLNANFGDGDLYVTYSFEEGKRPADGEGFKSVVSAFLKRLRRAYKKAGVPFRYVWVGERGGRGAAHLHMVQAGLPLTPGELKSLWGQGYVTVKPMDPSGSYHKLAAYFIKYSDKTMKTEGRLQGKRYNPSKNLVRPVPEKTRIMKKRRFDPEKIKVPDGWYLEKETVETGIQETGYEYMRYTLVMQPGYGERKRKKGRRRGGKRPPKGR